MYGHEMRAVVLLLLLALLSGVGGNETVADVNAPGNFCAPPQRLQRHSFLSHAFPASRPIATDLVVLSSFFNPARSVRLVENALFVRNMLQSAGIAHYVIEQVKDGSAFLVADSTTFHLRSDSCLFQKERLLNLLLRRVPASYTKVLFLDLDVVLYDPTSDTHWLDTVSALLDVHHSVQPFRSSDNIDLTYRKNGRVHQCSQVLIPRNAGESLSQAVLDLRKQSWRKLVFHPGYAWAYRRSLLEDVGGLFDLALVGGGDRLNAVLVMDTGPQAYNGSFANLVAHSIKPSFLRFRASFVRATGGKKLSVGHAESVELLHMWHGNTQSRQYNTRAHILDRVEDLEELVLQNEDGLYEVAQGGM